MKQSALCRLTRGKARRPFCAAALLLLAAALVLFSGCATAGGKAGEAAQAAVGHIEAALEAARSLHWQEAAPGIQQAALPAATCGTELVAAKIELAAVSITASIPEGEDDDGAFFSGEFAADFAARTGAALAVNMTPFFKKGSRLYPSSLCINGGALVSPPNEKYAAIFFFKEGGAAIASAQDESVNPLIKKAEFAFGGFWQVLEGGELADFPNYRQSRTVLGLDSSGQTLFVLAAAKASLLGSASGISFTEGAELIKALGAINAIQMDGGSSTCLAINGEQVAPSKRFFFVRKNRRTAVNVGFRAN